MSTPGQADPAKLVVSLVMKDKEIISRILYMLEDCFGDIDIISNWFNFDYTDYYYKEMGNPLFRRVTVFKKLIAQKDLAAIKKITNSFEKKWEKNQKRSINIDPGYLLLSRFILATGKDYAHRIYLDKGIYADLTLIYKQGKYCPLEWTYPDYASSEMIQFLKKTRQKYALDLKNIKNIKKMEKR
ncbi:MAG: DUF4416 family protein [Nitrospiraceae bacterium]|nr:DUF4416 family protein [Nitrospiraceae bacterium]